MVAGRRMRPSFQKVTDSGDAVAHHGGNAAHRHAGSAQLLDALGDIAVDAIAGLKVTYPDSYPASLFKNLAKCKALSKNI